MNKNIAPLSGIPLPELTQVLAPLPRYRAVQIVKWIAAGAASFNEMENLPLNMRAELTERFPLRPPVTAEKHTGDDSSVKLALQFSDGERIESVLLADNAARRTACLSTQAGCPAGCVFCKTGTCFSRNLDSSEMVEQFLLLNAIAKDACDNMVSNNAMKHPVANIVIMGMGEPLMNLAELRRALDVIQCKEGLHFSLRRITVSTCGIAEGIINLADNGPAVRLALSLCTGDEKLRQRLMPITVNQPLNRVKEALSYFQNKGGGRITLESVLLGGINTRNQDAAGIAQFANGLDAVVNIIPWNPVNGLEFEGKALREPTAAEVESFKRQLESLGLNVTRRFRRGRGISGACGQLGVSNEE